MGWTPPKSRRSRFSRRDRTRSLKELIEALPVPDVERKTVKELALMLLLETDGDAAGSDRTPRLNAKVEMLKLLRDLTADEGQEDATQELLALLGAPVDPPPEDD